MLTLAKFPFAPVDGVELSPQLAEVARRNLRRLGVSNATVFCCDAAEFTELDVYTYFYLYNPFPEMVLRSVIKNIESSLQRRSRTTTLIYKNALFDGLVVNAGFSRIAEFGAKQLHHPFAVYVGAPIKPIFGESRCVQ